MLPFEAVLFDYHTTLVDGGDAAAWLRQAAQRAGQAEPEQRAAALSMLTHVWEHATELDPDTTRDLSPADHHRVFVELLQQSRDLGQVSWTDELIEALYQTMEEQWHVYADTLPTLATLRQAGMKIAVVSNVGIDIRPLIKAQGIAEHLDATVMSYQVGSVKPAAAIFQAALAELGVSAESALMVGDSYRADGGAATVGIRTLILPRVFDAVRGLELVVHTVGAA